MKCFLRYIGVVDTQEKIHKVRLEPGLNVITGKSSTGKSAILEIFDYCLGSTEDTIPVGTITERAETFFIALQFPSYFIVAARKKKSDRCFLLEVQGSDPDQLLQLIEQPKAFFDPKHYMPLADFKKSLGRYFAITLENIDEDPYLKAAGRNKSATPSVRSFSSFMLQHQNLVANKHAIFYRFDEKEKRDQAINHFKILMGLVDEAYFDLYRDHEVAKHELKKIQAQIPKQAQRKEAAIARYNRYLIEFKSLAGLPLVDATAEDIYSKPATMLKMISGRSVKIDVLSDQVEMRRAELHSQRIAALIEKRKLQGQMRLVNESLTSATQFSLSMTAETLPDSIELSEAHCPLCEAHTSTPAMEANKLVGAIEWLNDELKLSAYARESFAAERRNIQDALDKANAELRRIQTDIQPLDEEIAKLKTSKSIDEQATKAKLRLEIAIQDQLDKPESELATEEKNLRTEVDRLAGLLEKYDIKDRLKTLSNEIDAKMCELGNHFDFEETYKPSKLRFDVETFDLWYQQNQNTRVYLRSMGSGANWLYSHLALFMSLHYQFAALSNKGCKIPPILFLDQPTQVYFPASLDDAEDFDAQELSKQAKREDAVDADMSAVTNMFTQLAKFCDETGKKTGVTPQIIVSDHADRLTLGEGYKFPDYVRATWRTRGFIAD
ncbi:DUF3732 domain-containing protein [Pseudomonas alliivorans]|uniref:DUF3732 domain-containing protein n=1 Tax=Pseudomonas TaxID=286 RepID=UPI000D3ACCF3|nr:MULTISPECIES: DUF3732 domain-containing protein [unclassified Pseudomonas]MEE5127947.1 DUF3732 domain-containing protein [Pseudomonas alliivorans]PUB43256.1 uncharacterized protein DUF3732 [Pseudomonas sp. GV047]WLH26046.1 DUF3732 domain-containing protein [Pseudomonas sp. FP215]